jgi:hypothetical protein
MTTGAPSQKMPKGPLFLRYATEPNEAQIQPNEPQIHPNEEQIVNTAQ